MQKLDVTPEMLRTARLVFLEEEQEPISSRQHVKVACEKCEKFYCLTCWKVCPRCK